MRPWWARAPENCAENSLHSLILHTNGKFTANRVRDPAAPPHNDPFNRIMLAQAKADGLVFLTHDSLILAYGEECVLSL